MLKANKIWILGVLAALALALCGCSAQDVTLPGQVDLSPGESYALALAAEYTGGELTPEQATALSGVGDAVQNIEFSFASTAPGVVTVDENGVLTANAPGTAAVVVQCASLDYYAEVQVKVTSLPTTLTTDPTALMEAGQTRPLDTTVLPWNRDVRLTYTSADPAVATVDADGVVTAVNNGETVVTVALAGSSLTAECAVSVGGVQGISLSRAAATLETGARIDLTAQVWPDATAAVAWQSSDPAVAVVDESGMVKAVAPGAAAITATALGKTAACTVAVNAPATPESATPETAETATVETATPETATTETAATPETATPETATPETATPETATPETATPETATPETATPETATSETATPETSTPETATPETAESKGPLPDLLDWLGKAGDKVGSFFTNLFGGYD